MPRATYPLTVSLTACLGLLLPAGPAAAGSPPANPAYQAGFPVVLDGTQVRASSIALGDLNGDEIPDIVVGASDGQVHAYTGFGVKLWSRDTGDMEIDSKPAIGDLDGDGINEVVVGAGSTFTPASDGGLYILESDGSLRCPFATEDSNNDTFLDGVRSSPALADLAGDSRLEIAFGAWDRQVRVIDSECNEVWVKDVIDTVWSSPAIGDIDNDGQLDVVIGVDSDDDPGPNGEEEGGILHVYRGNDGQELAGFPIQIDEVIQSSPGLADLTGDGRLEIVVGTGRCWSNPACAPDGVANPGVGEYLNVWDHTGTYLPGWPVAVPGSYAFASPALADLDNDGLPEVIINTIDPDDLNGGQVYALNADGSAVPGWPVQPTLPAGGGNFIHFSTAASPIAADLTGDGDLEVIMPSNWDLIVWDRNGNQLSRDDLPTPPGAFELRANQPIASSAAVGDIDGDGDLELVVGGFNETPPDNTGAIYAWDFPATTGAPQPWPMFRRTADNRAAAAFAIFSDGFESGDVGRWTP